MAQVISVHSFRGGTGKSNTTANVATLLAQEGRRVGVVDLDIQSPGVHVIFGFDQDRAMQHSLNDYLWGDCDLKDAAHDVGPSVDGGDLDGRLWLVPSSMRPGDIARVMHEGYDVNRLNEGFRKLVDDLSLDVLFLDTHPGINEETLLSIAMSNALVIVLRPDRQDYEGTHVTVAVARKLGVPRMVLVVNKAPEVFDPDDVRRRVEETYNCPVAAVLPHSDDLMLLSSEGVFSLRYPDHPLTGLYRDVAAQLAR
jgi:MinD-like ATPase involved in chromosome partitioning or flagellar assembly